MITIMLQLEKLHLTHIFKDDCVTNSFFFFLHYAIFSYWWNRATAMTSVTLASSTFLNVIKRREQHGIFYDCPASSLLTQCIVSIVKRKYAANRVRQLRTHVSANVITFLVSMSHSVATINICLFTLYRSETRSGRQRKRSSYRHTKVFFSHTGT